MTRNSAAATALAFALLAAGQAAAQLAAPPPFGQWKDYAPPEGGFIVRAPGPPQVRPWNDGSLVARHYLMGSVEESYSVTVIELPAEARGGLDAAGVAAVFAKRVIESMQPEKTETDEAASCAGGLPGRSLAAILADGLRYVGRVCVSAGRVFRVEAVIDAARWATAEPSAKGFVDSFRPGLR